MMATVMRAATDDVTSTIVPDAAPSPSPALASGRWPWWPVAFLALVVCYHLGPLLIWLGASGTLARFAMLAVYPVAALLAWKGGQGFGAAYGLAWRGRWWAWLVGLFAL